MTRDVGCADCRVAAADAATLIGVLSIDSGHCFEPQESHSAFCTVDPIGGALLVIPPDTFVVPIATGSPTFGPDATLYVDFEGTLR